MVYFTPGTFIGYQKAGSTLPPWPALVCGGDDMAPQSVLNRKPHGYCTLILLMGEPLQFEWSLTSEMREYDLMPDKVTLRERPGLEQAHDSVITAFQEGWDLGHWRAVTVDLREAESCSSPESDSSHGSDIEALADEDLQVALQVSLTESNRKRSVSPASKDADISPEKKLHAQPIGLSPFTRSPSRTDTALLSHPNPPSSLDDARQGVRTNYAATDIRSFLHKADDVGRSSMSMKSHNNLENDTPRADLAHVAELRLNKNRLLDRGIEGLMSSSSHNFANKKERDIVQDIEDSNAYVEFSIGPDEKKFHIPHKDIQSRAYFKKKEQHYLVPKGSQGWTFNRPILAKIDPDDFQFVADYLSTGEFGYRIIEEDDDREVALAQCVAAWDVAEQLGMEDLLEHIVEKMAYVAPWDMGEVLAFASLVYQTSGTLLPAHGKMKSLLSTFIANNFWDYYYSDFHSENFADRLQQMPELEADVFEKRAESKRKQLDPEPRNSEVSF